jgi:integrase/recombinase XerD
VARGAGVPAASGGGSALAVRVSDLSRWLDAEGVSAAELGPRRVEQFLAARRAAGYVTRVASSSLRVPLEYLSEIGVVPALGTPSAAGPVDRLVEGYRRYLTVERGLARTTIAGL